MTYRDKLTQSEHKAHYQNIATKILREMSSLRASVETSPNTPRRWIWELLQNAKDVSGSEGVNIKIATAEKNKRKYLIFQHDGRPFTADNIRFLIEQISSKDRTKDVDGRRKETGKFGTGFLTTHLLSDTVVVKGVVKEQGLKHRKFTLKLDRSGFDIDDIIKAVEVSKEQILDIDSTEPYLAYDASDLNTSFIYHLEDDLSKEIMQQGLTDLNVNLPYTLCFVDDINTVTIADEAKAFKITKKKLLNNKINIITVEITDKKKHIQVQRFASLSKGLTSVLIPISIENANIKILPVGFDVPKIFCDFPLLGTESFPFPAVINNPGFNPTDPRDGIFLTDSTRINPLVEENKLIISDAVQLYFDLLKFAITNKWDNLYLLAKIGYLKEPVKSNTSVKWFEENVQNPMRERLSYSKIVKTSTGSLNSMLNPDGSEYIEFPSGLTKEIRKEIWHLASMWFPDEIPEMSHVEFWNSSIWNDLGRLTLLKVADFIEVCEDLSDLDSRLDFYDAITWLNKFYQVLEIDPTEYLKIIDSKNIVPNQNGDFVKKRLLKKQTDKIEPVFKDILKLFGNDLRSHLVHEKINLDFEDHDNYSQEDAVRELNAEILEKTHDRDTAQNFRPALNKVLKYFNEHPVTAKSLFPIVYSKKYILYDDEEIMDNIDKAEALKDLLEVFNVSSADELRRKFENYNDNGKALLPVTEEILTSMGITNIQEWEEAMQDTDLSALFDHQSVPTKDMFVLSQSHINRARAKVIAHLETLNDYDLSELDTNTAPTILAGVLKNESPVRIVFRPAYAHEVIVYYGAEKDALDYADAELWVDDGSAVRQISLGHILKINNIKKFPI